MNGAVANLIAQLRAAYTAEPVPPCRVCGGALSVAECGYGRPTIWACSPTESDPENPGASRTKPGRGVGEFDPRTGHYALSEHKQYRVGDSRVLHMLDLFGKMTAMLAAAPAPAAPTFQERVKRWMLECFGAAVALDTLERGDRFLEEALELLQATGYPRERCAELVRYVFDRPIGEPVQEVGGVMVTLAALCYAHAIDLDTAADLEVTRVEAPAVMEKIRAKQAAKPHGSALPMAPNPEDAP
jgi:hypothetical protein